MIYNRIFEYFEDIEDKDLQARNIGVFSTNLLEDHFDKKENRLTPKGVALLIQYWQELRNRVDQEFYQKAFLKFEEFTAERGFANGK